MQRNRGLAESKAAYEAAIETLKIAIDSHAADTALVQSVINVKLAVAAIEIIVPDTCDD